MVASSSTAETTRIEIAAIVAAMVGAEVKEHYPKERNATAEPLLEVEGLATASGVREHVHLASRRGFRSRRRLGSGRTAIARALFGLDRPTAGRIRLAAGQLRAARAEGHDPPPASRFSPRTANRTACSSTSTRREHHDRRISARSSAAAGSTSPREHAAQPAATPRSSQISPEAERKSVELLSGGNQQKIVIARWLHAEAEVFILDQPTQGIDIGAKIAVYGLINELTRAGKGVILISADDDELLAMSDRVALVRHGAVVAHRGDASGSTRPSSSRAARSQRRAA